jgi:hemerythrin-like domain-containing protein
VSRVRDRRRQDVLEEAIPAIGDDSFVQTAEPELQHVIEDSSPARSSAFTHPVACRLLLDPRMKATALLEQQHREVEAIFDRLEQAKGEPSALLTQLANDLAAHIAIEQNLFYPAVREVKSDLIDASFEEHAIAEVALKRLLRTPPSDPSFAARVSTLAELVMHHVEEEEEELLPAVASALGDAELERLGASMEKAFLAARQEGFEALVPSTLAKTSADVALERIRGEAPAAAPPPNGSAARR